VRRCLRTGKRRGAAKWLARAETAIAPVATKRFENHGPAEAATADLLALRAMVLAPAISTSTMGSQTTESMFDLEKVAQDELESRRYGMRRGGRGAPGENYNYNDDDNDDDDDYYYDSARSSGGRRRRQHRFECAEKKLLLFLFSL
jgi:hypothetical protein